MFTKSLLVALLAGAIKALDYNVDTKLAEGMMKEYINLDNPNQPPKIEHEVYAEKQVCATSSWVDGTHNLKLDQCQQYCEKLQKTVKLNVVGYWWSSWRGGHCGCCNSLNNLTDRWTHTTVYKFKPGQKKTMSNYFPKGRCFDEASKVSLEGNEVYMLFSGISADQGDFLEAFKYIQAMYATLSKSELYCNFEKSSDGQYKKGNFGNLSKLWGDIRSDQVSLNGSTLIVKGNDFSQ